jgi:hypothetical protein
MIAPVAAVEVSVSAVYLWVAAMLTVTLRATDLVDELSHPRFCMFGILLSIVSLMKQVVLCRMNEKPLEQAQTERAALP